MKIVQLKLNQIKPYNKNPRVNDNAVSEVAKSIKEFGFQQPIVVDKKNVIIIGHTRLLAAKELKLKTVPVLYANDLTPKKVKALRIADNKVGELADWDFDLLKNELEGLENFYTGFDDGDNLLLDGEAPEDFNSVDEDIETEHKCPKCKYSWSGKSK